MATAVDICNLALSILGDSGDVTSIKPPDGSPQAGHCARWYPLALRKLFEEHDWSFAIRRSRGVELSNVDEDIYEWKHSFLLPSDCVRLLRVSEVGREGMPLDFEVELYESNSGRAVFTDAKDIVLTYVSYVDTASIFPTYFVQALTLLLASFLLGPVKRSDSTSDVAVRLLQQYEAALSRAKTADSKAGVHRHRAEWPLPSGLRARVI